MSARMSQARERLFTFPPCVRGCDGLLISLVGLDHDSSEWVKLGLMDEAERLDRHWASWTNYTRVGVFALMLCVYLLLFFHSVVRMCAGPFTLEETSAMQNQSAQNRRLTSTLS